MITKNLFNNTISELNSLLHEVKILKTYEKLLHDKNKVIVKNDSNGSEKNYLCGETKKILFLQIDAQMHVLRLAYWNKNIK